MFTDSIWPLDHMPPAPNPRPRLVTTLNPMPGESDTSTLPGNDWSEPRPSTSEKELLNSEQMKASPPSQWLPRSRLPLQKPNHGATGPEATRRGHTPATNFTADAEA